MGLQAGRENVPSEKQITPILNLQLNHSIEPGAEAYTNLASL